ncbi:MAG: hypothetical protein ACOY31_12300 [Bacillota bacterium]
MGFSMYEKRGAVSIHLLIIFSVVVVFIGLLIDLSRIKVAQNQLARAVNASARSVLAGYDPSLKNEFGIFTPVEGADCQKEFEKYLLANLSISDGQDFSLFDYCYIGSQIYMSGPLGDREVLKRQILEDMKYRAPVELTLNLIEKFRAIAGMCSFFDRSNNKRKKMEQVNEKLEGIKKSNDVIRDKKKKLKDREENLSSVRAGIEELESKPDKQPADIDRLESLRAEETGLEEDIQGIKRDIEDEVQKASDRYGEVEKEIKELESTGDSGVYDVDFPVDEGQGVGEPPGDGVQKRIEDSEKAVDDQLSAEVNQINKELEDIGRDIENSKEAIGRGRYDDTGIDSAEKAHERAEKAKRENSVEGDPPPSILEEERNRLAGPSGITLEEEKISRDKDSFQEQEKENEKKLGGKDSDVGGITGALDRIKKIFSILSARDMLISLRDQIYINEYVLTYFSRLTAEKGDSGYKYIDCEAEYVLTGSENNAAAMAVAGVYGLRFSFDSVAYFVFSKAPVDLLSRIIYSLIMGAIQATIDVYNLTSSDDATVAIAEMWPKSPLEQVTVTYRDHLRILLLLFCDGDTKLDRIIYLVNARKGIDLAGKTTVVEGSAEVSIKMWFLPLAGVDKMSSGPFGTVIRDGRCYITRDVAYGY